MIVKSTKLLQSSYDEKIDKFLSSAELSEETSDAIDNLYGNMLEQEWLIAERNGTIIYIFILDIEKMADKELTLKCVIFNEHKSIEESEFVINLDSNRNKIVGEISKEEVFQKMEEFKGDMLSITNAITNKSVFENHFNIGGFYKNTYGRFGTITSIEETIMSCNHVAYIGPIDHTMYLEEPEELQHYQPNYRTLPFCEHHATKEEYENEIDKALSYFRVVEVSDEEQSESVAQ